MRDGVTVDEAPARGGVAGVRGVRAGDKLRNGCCTRPPSPVPAPKPAAAAADDADDAADSEAR